MQIISDEEKRALWEEVCREFPDDEAMQQVHYVRLLHYHQTKGMTPAEKLAFYAQERKESA